MSPRSHGQLFCISLVLVFVLAAGGLVSLNASLPPLNDSLELKSFSPLPICKGENRFASAANYLQPKKQKGDNYSRVLTLAENGRTNYSIVVASGLSSDDPEITAARELKNYLKQVTGAEFSIISEQAAAGKAYKILIGQSKSVKRLLPDINWDALGHDGIIIRTVGDSLILAGGKPRGTIYAVYTFLEDIVGIRWWTSTESYVPTKKTLRISKLNTVYVPKILYREAFYEDTNANPLFAVKLKLNGHFTLIPKEYGGHYSILGWCHTFYSLLPPAIYFAKHPEWYSEINGKRIIDKNISRFSYIILPSMRGFTGTKILL